MRERECVMRERESQCDEVENVLVQETYVWSSLVEANSFSAREVVAVTQSQVL